MQMLFLPGLQNVVTDFLSRPASVHGDIATVKAVAPANPEAIATEQNHCSETQRLLNGTSLTIAFKKVGNQHLVGQVSAGDFRPVVPTKYQ